MSFNKKDYIKWGIVTVIIFILIPVISILVNRIQENKDSHRVITCLFITCEDYNASYADYDFISENCYCYIYNNSTDQLILNKTEYLGKT